MAYTVKSVGSSAADYTKLSLWESGTDAAGTDQEAQLQDEVHTEAATTVTVAGAAVLRRVTCATGAFHRKKRLTGAQTSGFRILSSETGFQIVRTSHRIVGATLQRIALTGLNQIADGCLVTDAEAGLTEGIILSGTSVGGIVRNCLVFGVSRHGIQVDTLSDTGSVANCTVANSGQRGVNMVGVAEVRCQNNLCGNNGSDEIAGYSDVTNQGGNVTSKAFTGSIGSDLVAPLADQIVNATAGNEDGTLLSTATAKDAGLDLSAFFTTDCDGDLRAVPWDSGADQFDVHFDPTDGLLVGPVTDVILGTHGQQGDFLDTVVLNFTADSPGDVSIRDGNGPSILIRKGGFAFLVLGSSTEDPPNVCILKIRSRTGPWRISVAAGWRAKITGQFS